jgi:prolyl-tRNA editing enzyme YbaK/EbsC (Cys-tRNA(Pro) deacylase)
LRSVRGPSLRLCRLAVLADGPVVRKARAMLSGERLHPSAAAVVVALDEIAPGAEVRQLDTSTRSAAEAATALGCEVGAIASSLVFMADDGPVLIMTSGAHRVDLDLVAAEAGLTGLRKATAVEVRAATGQAIGGVAPVGHPAPLRTLVDRDLARYPELWAAAGAPHAVFATTFEQLVAITAGTVQRVSKDRPA